MAGLGRKSWTVGEVLTSSDLNGYLMDQSVMRFDSAAARNTALGTAVAPGNALASGMTAYLDDVDRLKVYYGNVWGGAEGILQQTVVQRTTDITAVSATCHTVSGFTPMSSNSLIIVDWFSTFQVNRNSGSPRDRRCEFRIQRVIPSVSITVIKSQASGMELTGTSSSDTRIEGPIRVRRIEPSGSTSSRDYEAVMLAQEASTVSVTDYGAGVFGPSTFIVTEVIGDVL